MIVPGLRLPFFVPELAQQIDDVHRFRVRCRGLPERLSGTGGCAAAGAAITRSVTMRHPSLPGGHMRDGESGILAFWPPSRDAWERRTP